MIFWSVLALFVLLAVTVTLVVRRRRARRARAEWHYVSPVVFLDREPTNNVIVIESVDSSSSERSS